MKGKERDKSYHQRHLHIPLHNSWERDDDDNKVMIMMAGDDDDGEERSFLLSLSLMYLQTLLLLCLLNKNDTNYIKVKDVHDFV